MDADKSSKSIMAISSPPQKKKTKNKKQKNHQKPGNGPEMIIIQL